MRRGAIEAGLALCTLVGIASGALGSSFDYLYIEANEGDSSGGHAAIRFAGWVYHFQHDRGLVLLRRDSWKRFEHRYRTLKNRGISLSRVETSDETYERLRAAFHRRYLVQQRELRLLDELQREVELFEQLSNRHPTTAAPHLVVRGVGFFRAGTAGPRGIDARVLSAIRLKAESRYGPNFLQQRATELRAALATLKPEHPPLPQPDPQRYPAVAKPFAEHHSDLHTAIAAIDVLAGGPHALAPSMLVAPSEQTPLPRGARPQLRSLADSISSSLLRLLSSRRSDWAYPFLLGLARLVAIERSLEQDRWILLDAMPPDAESLELIPRRRAALPELFEEALRDRDDALARVLSDTDLVEATWSAFETAVARVAELRRALGGAAELRVRSGAWLPSGNGSVPIVATQDSLHDAGVHHLRAARARKRSFEKALRKRYAYHLLLRNCVSEIFRTIDSALAGEEADPLQVRNASELHLGGYVAPTDELNFIPFISERHVRDNYSVVSRVDLPSFRHYHLDRLHAGRFRPGVALRESNVWSSTLYSPSEEDGFFVFFTDRTVALRPALGALNLVASVAKSAAGVVSAPFDKGRALRAGASGILFSVPELLFVNLRKGSNEYVRREMRPPATP